MATSPPAQAHSGRRILLADADAFYVAVARLADPDGVGKEPLLIVGGSSTRGVVTSASYEARQFGVRSAMPTARALRLCPQAVVVPVPRDLCSRKSREIREVLERFSPVVEPASIDEFYVDMSGTEQLYAEDLTATARRICHTVLEVTGLSISIGGGTSRLVAKLAAKKAKPRRETDGGGVYVVPPGEEAAFVSKLALAEIPMIGPTFQDRLAERGLHTVCDALPHDVAVLQGWFGKRTGGWLYDRIRGVDSGHIEGRPRSKSMSHEETFIEDIESDEALGRELLRLALRVAADVRRCGYRTRTVTVKIRDWDFNTRQASETLSEPVSADRPVLETAQGLLKRLRRKRRVPARLLGVALSQLVREQAPVQLSMFDQPIAPATETEKDRAITHVVDDINAKFGRQGIRRGAEVGKRKPPRGRQD